MRELKKVFYVTIAVIAGAGLIFLIILALEQILWAGLVLLCCLLLAHSIESMDNLRR